MEENKKTQTEELSNPPPSYNVAVGAQSSGQNLSNAINTQPHLTSSSAATNIPRIPNCPPGLEYLTLIDQMLIKQQVSEWNNKFVIKNTMGQNVYWANEDADCCGHCCFGANRPFDMKVTDIHNNEVMHFFRPAAMGYNDSIEVSAPVGQKIGRIIQMFNLLLPTFKVKDHNNETVLRIEGPMCTTSFFGDVDFNIVSLDGTTIGKISKQWSGLAREFFTDADYFGINFPMDLPVQIKATLLGACLLINSMYYERN